MFQVFHLVELFGLQSVLCRSFLSAPDGFLTLHLLQLLVQSAHRLLFIYHHVLGSNLRKTSMSNHECKKVKKLNYVTSEFSGASQKHQVFFALVCRSSSHPPFSVWNLLLRKQKTFPFFLVWKYFHDKNVSFTAFYTRFLSHGGKKRLFLDFTHDKDTAQSSEQQNNCSPKGRKKTFSGGSSCWELAFLHLLGEKENNEKLQWSRKDSPQSY